MAASNIEIEVRIDLSKAESEFKRMVSGETSLSFGYLAELVEIGPILGDMVVFPADGYMYCEECNIENVIRKCPECELAPMDDCGLCDGMGGWLECPECEGE